MFPQVKETSSQIRHEKGLTKAEKKREFLLKSSVAQEKQVLERWIRKRSTEYKELFWAYIKVEVYDIQTFFVESPLSLPKYFPQKEKKSQNIPKKIEN